MQSQGTGRDSPPTVTLTVSADDGRRPAADQGMLADLADEIDRAIGALPASSLSRPWLVRVSGALRAGAGLRAIRAVARRDGGETA